MEHTQLDMAYLIRVLRSRGLISPALEKSIRQKAPAQKAKLTQICEVRSCGRPGHKSAEEVTPVDVLASMELQIKEAHKKIAS